MITQLKDSQPVDLLGFITEPRSVTLRGDSGPTASDCGCSNDCTSECGGGDGSDPCEDD